MKSNQMNCICFCVCTNRVTQRCVSFVCVCIHSIFLMTFFLFADIFFALWFWFPHSWYTNVFLVAPCWLFCTFKWKYDGKTGFSCVISIEFFLSPSFCLFASGRAIEYRDFVGVETPFNFNSYVNCVKLIDDKEIVNQLHCTNE